MWFFVYENLNVLLFSVSNEVPEHPVVSPVSGSIFERRLIEKYILENGIDPISGKELTNEMLIEVKSNKNLFKIYGTLSKNKSFNSHSSCKA